MGMRSTVGKTRQKASHTPSAKEWENGLDIGDVCVYQLLRLLLVTRMALGHIVEKRDPKPRSACGI